MDTKGDIKKNLLTHSVQFHFHNEDLTQETLDRWNKAVVFRYKFGEHMKQYKYCYVIAPPEVARCRFIHEVSKQALELFFRGEVVL